MPSDRRKRCSGRDSRSKSSTRDDMYGLDSDDDDDDVKIVWRLPFDDMVVVVHDTNGIIGVLDWEVIGTGLDSVLGCWTCLVADVERVKRPPTVAPIRPPRRISCNTGLFLETAAIPIPAAPIIIP